MDQHEAADRLHLAHAVQELGVRDVGVGGIGDRHEGLEPGRPLGPLILDLGDRRRGQRTPQAEVGDHLLLRHLPLLAVELGGGHRRIGERVLDHRGHSTGRGRHGAGGEVLALGVPGILEVGVHVDGAGQHDQAGGVDQFVGAAAIGPLGDRGDAAVLDHDVCREHAVVGGQRAAGDHGALAAHGGEVLCRGMAGTEPSKAIVSSLWIRRLRAQRLRDTRFVLMSSSARRSLLRVERVPRILSVAEAKLADFDRGSRPSPRDSCARQRGRRRVVELGTEGCEVRLRQRVRRPAGEFAQLGINVTVLEPGETGLYHAEVNQEAFLILSGECELLVEHEQRRLRPWDFVHCPPSTEHAFVGAGEMPCVILMVGSRSERGSALPGVGARGAPRRERGEETSDWRQAYATVEQFRRRAGRLGFACPGPAAISVNRQALLAVFRRGGSPPSSTAGAGPATAVSESAQAAARVFVAALPA